jgi:hypothetical protein
VSHGATPFYRTALERSRDVVTRRQPLTNIGVAIRIGYRESASVRSAVI